LSQGSTPLPEFRDPGRSGPGNCRR